MRIIALAAILLLAGFVQPATTAGAKRMAHGATTYYVDVDAGGGSDGLAWATAFVTLQDALAIAADGDQIWVAAGTYYPDEGGGISDGDESASFTIPSGVALYGGFDPGAAADTFAERDWEAYPAILSGDIANNDGGPAADGIIGDNSDHVLYLDGKIEPVTETTVIDGFSIEGGQADGAGLDANGGGIFCDADGIGSVCSPTLRNVAFRGNFAGSHGGAMFNNATGDGESSPQLINVAFSGNASGENGGALFNNSSNGESSPWLTNVAFSGNRAGNCGGALYNYVSTSGSSSPKLANVTFQGNEAVFVGGALCISSDGGSNDLQLSSVILWGDEALIANELYNRNSDTVIRYSIVQGWVVGGTTIVNEGDGSVIDGGHNVTANPRFVMPIDADWAPTTAGDLRLQSESPAINAGDSASVPAGVATDLDGGPRFYGGVDIGAYEFALDTLYVDAAAGGRATGTSWEDGYTNLQDAIAFTNGALDVWVATGTYFPDAGGGMMAGDEGASFVVPAGVGLYGGFDPNAGADSLAERDPFAYPAILSGDIDNNDTSRTLAGIVGDNSDHVLVLDGTVVPVTSVTTIDGFTITGGQADGNYPASVGGGLYCNGEGGVCRPSLHNLTFDGNTASSRGGALYNNGRSFGSSSPELSNITFSDNSATSGGAIYNDGLNGDSSPLLIGVTFRGNAATEHGGALFNNGFDGVSSPLLTNVHFSGNSAGEGGGAVYSDGSFGGSSSPSLTNVTFSGNRAASGGAMYSDGSFGGSSSPPLTNVILWGDEAAQGSELFNNNASPNISHSIVQGGAQGAGNLDVDPLFVLPVDAGDAPTTAGDLRLQSGSPGLNSGDSAALPAGVTTDRDGGPRFYGGVDIGAYERALGILYVDAAADGRATGTSWDDGYTNLQDAVAYTNAALDVWVAAGTYYPDEGGGMVDGDEGASFVVPAAVRLYGGFDPSAGANTFGERDWIAYPTILSGDVDNNDTARTADGIVGDNSDHVLYLDGQPAPLTATTVIDGFTVTGGQANGAAARDKRGGGLYCDGRESGGECSPMLSHLVFQGNRADLGGALYNAGRTNGSSSPTLLNVVFRGNLAVAGGAVYNHGRFEGDSSPIFTNVTFSGNRGQDGGALLNDGSFNGSSSPTLNNVSFSGNAAVNGGAIYSTGHEGGGSGPLLTNVILWRNGATTGSEMYNRSANPTIGYSIVQGGVTGSRIFNDDGSVIDGGNNGSRDPQYLLPVNPATAPTTAGDLRLMAGSPAVDAGDNGAVAGITTDLDGNTRIVNSTVDIGAFERQALPTVVRVRSGAVVAPGAAVWPALLAVAAGLLLLGGAGCWLRRPDRAVK